MSYTVINNKRVYGKKFAYGSLGPTDIPLDIFKPNRNILEEAEYTKAWLDNKFGKEFPDISFKPSRLYKLDISVLTKIAHGVGIKYLRNRKTTVQEKRALCRAIQKTIC
jgi:hypothetical protein